MQPRKYHSIEEKRKSATNRWDNGAPGIHCSASSPSAAKQCPQTGRDFQRMWQIVKVLPGKTQASYLQHNSQIRDAVIAILPMPEPSTKQEQGL